MSKRKEVKKVKKVMKVNLVLLIGHLGADPESRYTPKGKALTTFSIVLNEALADEEGEEQKRTLWVRCVCWDKLGENAKKYLHKGSRVDVTGSLRQRSWTTDQGEKRTEVEVNARKIEFLDRKPQERVADFFQRMKKSLKRREVVRKMVTLEDLLKQIEALGLSPSEFELDAETYNSLIEEAEEQATAEDEEGE